MSKVSSIFPANNFEVVADSAKEEIEVGIIIGYDEHGRLCVYGGGMMGNRQPVAKDWLWLVETFKRDLLAGDYSG